MLYEIALIARMSGRREQPATPFTACRQRSAKTPGLRFRLGLLDWALRSEPSEFALLAPLAFNL